MQEKRQADDDEDDDDDDDSTTTTTTVAPTPKQRLHCGPIAAVGFSRAELRADIAQIRVARSFP
eukprot:2728397-Pyramimonas_sp.AAC.1